MLKMQQVGVSLEYVTVTSCNNIKKKSTKLSVVPKLASNHACQESQ